MPRTTSPHPATHLLHAAAARAARLALATTLLAAPFARATDRYYLGAQYTPGPGYPTPWPTDGSWFDKNLWLTKTLPTSYDNVIFDSNQLMTNGNTTHAPHTLYFGNFGYFGTTTISGGIASASIIYIQNSDWTFNLGSAQNPEFTGTLIPSSGTLTADAIYLSPAAGQSASLALQGGSIDADLVVASRAGGQALATLGPGTYLSNYGTSVGRYGSGTLVQTGGTITSRYSLYVGENPGSSGCYNLSAGLLSVSTEYIGYYGSGTFTQTGGTHTISGSLVMADKATAPAVYTLSDGVLTTGQEYLGYYGAATFTQTGGTHTLSGNLYLANNPGSTGVYSLSGGTLAAASEILNSYYPGTFTQTGGTNTISGLLDIGTASRYELTGGTLRIGGFPNLTRPGTLVLGGTATLALTNPGATVDFSSFTLLDVSQFTITAAANSVLFLPAANFGTITSPGAVFRDQGPSVVPATMNVNIAARNLNTTLLCAGTLTGTGSLTGGLQLQGTVPKVTLAKFYAENSDSALAAGQLNLSTAYIGYASHGVFTQSGGTHSVTGTVCLGFNAGSSGSYALSGGQLTASAEYLGVFGSANFSQTGGTHTVQNGLHSGTLCLGETPSGSAAYILGGGRLAPDQEYVGYSGSGTFTQTTGSHIITDRFSLGHNAGASGTYTLGDGLLSASTVTVGNYGSGIFMQTGGTHTITQSTAGLYVGAAAQAAGVYTLADGLLKTPGEWVGYAGTGTFTQSGGTHIISGGFSSPISTLFVGRSSNAVGSFVLTGGQLTAASEFIGYEGTSYPTPGFSKGFFTQSGGTHTLSGTLALGYANPAVGVYTLDGGQLAAAIEFVGYYGSGTFTQTNGTHTIAGTNSGLFLGTQTGSSGTYLLSGGTLTAPKVSVGSYGSGTFTQTGGTHTVSGTLTIINVMRGTSAYTLGDGLLTTSADILAAESNILRPGTFTQTGGTHTTGSVAIFPGGTLSVTGGTLQVTGGLFNFGRLQLGGTADLHLTGLVDLAQADLHDVGGVSLTLAPNSLLILPAGFSPDSFASYSNPGGLAAADGTPVLIPANTLIAAGSGSGRAQILCAGTLTGSATLAGTLQVQENASATLDTLRLDSADSSLSGGQLTAAHLYLGYSGAGTFTQTGGTSTVSRDLNLGNTSGTSGVYILTNGQLDTQDTIVRTGTFTQSGGTHTVRSNFQTSPATSAVGVYALNDGVLTAPNDYVGILGMSTILQTGGTHTVSGLISLATYSKGVACYALSGTGILSAANLYLGGLSTAAGGTGTFSISGGTATIANTLKLWNSANTTLTLSGGTLSVKTLDISLNPAAFTWTAGTLILTGPTAPSLTIPAAGTFQGSPTISGNLTNNGLLSPGQSPGLLTIQGDFTQSATATLLLEIAGPALPDFDRLTIPGTTTLPGNISLSGTIALSFLPTYTPTLGDTFDLLDWTGTFTDQGYTFDFTHAPLPADLVWDTSNFPTTGQLSLIAIPEPASLALLALATPLLLTRRRQKSPRT